MSDSDRVFYDQGDMFRIGSLGSIKGLSPYWRVVRKNKNSVRVESAKSGDRATFNQEMLRIGIDDGDVEVLPIDR